MTHVVTVENWPAVTTVELPKNFDNLVEGHWFQGTGEPGPPGHQFDNIRVTLSR